METLPAQVVELAATCQRVCVLTGAGMSAESGIPTFRGGDGSLWSRFDPTLLATPDAWRRDRALVWAWYLWRAAAVQRAVPHAGHRALGEWSRRPAVSLTVVTQNVDDLHERAGCLDVLHVHGSLLAFRCDTCGAPPDEAPVPPPEPITRIRPPRCLRCQVGWLRPGVVWFGEPLDPWTLDAAVAAVQSAELTLVVGTSGIVYPAAALPAMARDAGSVVVEVNPEPTDLSGTAHHVIRSTAARALPELIGLPG